MKIEDYQKELEQALEVWSNPHIQRNKAGNLELHLDIGTCFVAATGYISELEWSDTLYKVVKVHITDFNHEKKNTVTTLYYSRKHIQGAPNLGAYIEDFATVDALEYEIQVVMNQYIQERLYLIDALIKRCATAKEEGYEEIKG